MKLQTLLNRISRRYPLRVRNANIDHSVGFVATPVLLIACLLLLGWPVLAANIIDEEGSASAQTSRDPQNDLCAATGTEWSGSIVVPTTWLEVDSPHHVTGDVTVRSGVRLTIEPGVVVCFAAGTALHVGQESESSVGQLVAEGESDKPIIFTADDSSPSRGYWMGLDFGSASLLNSLRYCVIEYAGTGVSINNSDYHSIDNCIFRHNGDGDDGFSSGGAIHAYGDGTNFSFNEIHDNELGIRLRNSNENYVGGNQIYNNDGFGIGLVDEEGYGGDTNLIESNQIYGNGGNGVSLDLGSDNQILDNEITTNGGNGIWVQNQSGIQIMRNVVRANVQNGLVYALDNSAPVGIDSNVLCGNFALNLLNLWPTELNAEGNWFGTNTPNADGKISDFVDFDPWIQADVTLDPTSLPADGTSIAQFQVTMDDGGSHAVPDGYVVYAMASQGSLAETMLALTSGQATTTYTAGIAPGPVDFGVADDCKELDFSGELTLQGVDLAIAKEGPGGMTWPGQWVTYTIGISELVGIDAPNVVVTDLLPVGATWVADTGADCGLDRQETAPDVVWTKTQWDRDEECWFDVTVEVGSAACAQDRLENSVLIASSMGDEDESNNNWTTTDDSPTVTCLDLAVRKEDGAGLVPVLQPEKAYLITYTLTYTNEGSTDATGVVLTDSLPSGTQFYAGNGWTCAGDECTHTIGSLPVGGRQTAPPLVVEVLTPTLAGCDSLLDSAAIGDDGVHGPDLEPEDNEFDLSTPLPCLPDLVLAKTSDAEGCVSGSQTITYTLAYTNTGLAGATGVLLTETVPANTTHVGGWTCDGDTCTRSVADLPKGGSGSVEFAIQVDELFPEGQIVNEAQIGSLEADIDPRDNEVLLTTPVCAAGPDLQVTKTDGGVILGPNKEYLIEYTITVSNAGGIASSGVVLTDMLPLEASYDGTDWSCATGKCSYSIGTLVPAASVQVTLPLELEKSQIDCPITITNTVWVTDDGASGMDLLPANNVFTLRTTSECPSVPVINVYLPLIMKAHLVEYPTPTSSPTPTATPTSTSTSTPTPTATSTSTPTPSTTPTPSITPTPSSTPTPTEPPEETFVQDVAVNPETNRVYVSSPELDSVLVVNPSGAGSVIASIPVGRDPIGLAVVASTNKIYAANFNSRTVTAIRGSDHTPITSIYVGDKPSKVTSDSGDARVYVANHLEIQNGAAAIDSQTDQFLYYYSRLHAAQGRYGIDVDPEAERLFIAARDSGLIAIQDAYYPLREPQILKLDPPRVPYVLAFNPTTNHLFVTAAEDNRVVVLAPYSIQWSRGRWTTSLGQAVLVLDQTNAGWIKEIIVGEGAEEGIAVNPNTGYVYVTNADSNTVSVIKDDANPAQITLVKTVTVGEYPQGVDVDLNTNYVYVANADSRDLTVIEGINHNVIKTIPLD